jgi:phosphatidylglycerophosphatase A
MSVIPFFASGAYLGIVLLILAAVYVAGQAAKFWGQKDPSRVVADEIVGYLASVCWIPLTWVSVIGGFLIFRLMDIFKPFPIRKIDREMRGGWGIVLDDVLAGIYTNILLRMILWAWF